MEDILILHGALRKRVCRRSILKTWSWSRIKLLITIFADFINLGPSYHPLARPLTTDKGDWLVHMHTCLLTCVRTHSFTCLYLSAKNPTFIVTNVVGLPIPPLSCTTSTARSPSTCLSMMRQEYDARVLAAAAVVGFPYSSSPSPSSPSSSSSELIRSRSDWLWGGLVEGAWESGGGCAAASQVWHPVPGTAEEVGRG